ncbi:DUF2007 domain-containing protein [Psychromonas aquatilis]|uniref:DUF2007 domain-containing protein n=1 Tax=Psychromonas aquatilis TaxID=2005072 RepID=A0ABU9GQC9_9GAMM
MKLVYTHENQFLVSNIKNIIEAEGIATFLKNEFAKGAMGEVSTFDCWPEVWVYEDADFEKAKSIVALSQSTKLNAEWVCEHCNEKNDAAFEVCWSCQHDPSDD